MFLLPAWMPDLKPEMTSSSSSETVTMTTSAPPSSSSPLSHPESAFAAYKTMNVTAAAPSIISLHPPPPPTLPSPIFERGLWQNLLPPDTISAAAAVAAAVRTHPGPMHSTWNSGFDDLQMDTGLHRLKNGARESTGTLKAWLCRNLKNPYPSKGEKIMLAIITRMTLTQVSTWFANARRRLKKEHSFRWQVDDDDYSDEYNDDNDDDGRDGNDLLSLDEDEESSRTSLTRSPKRKRPKMPDDCSASKRRCSEDRSMSKRKRSVVTEEEKANGGGLLQNLILTRDESGDADNKAVASPLGSLTCSSSSPSAYVPLSTSTYFPDGRIGDQQVALEDTKSDVAPPGSVYLLQAADAATAVDLSITSKTNYIPVPSSSSSFSSSSSSASATVKPRIWSIVEIATT